MCTASARAMATKNWRELFVMNLLHGTISSGVETFHGGISDGVANRYADLKMEDDGGKGPLHVGFAKEWEKDLMEFLGVFEQARFPLNPDHNTGNPIGISVLINSAHNGLRSTAGDRVKEKLENLTILTGAPVQHVLLQGAKATGVESNGKKWEKISIRPSCLGALYILPSTHRPCQEGSYLKRRLAE